jgi:tetratricopeptide (TPR) repeat protein
MSEEELTSIAVRLATEAVDEEIAHHPELFSQRETLISSKTKRFAHEIEGENSDLLDEIDRAAKLIQDYFATYPTNEREALFEKLYLAQDESDPNKTLQENMGLPEEVMQAIYGYGVEMQNRDNHPDAAAIFKFLITLNPFIADFWTALGMSQICQHKDIPALKSFENSLKINPENLRSYYFIAYTQHLLKDDSASLATLEEGLKLTESPTYEEWGPILQEIQTNFSKETV